MPYQLGVTEANMVDLEDLRLPDPDPLCEPLSDFAPFSGTKIKGNGEVVGTGRPQFVWKFNILTIRQMGTLLYYVSTGGALVASKVVYVQTRIASPNMEERVFQSYRARMLLPAEPGAAQYDVNRLYQNVTVQFVQAVAI